MELITPHELRLAYCGSNKTELLEAADAIEQLQADKAELVEILNSLCTLRNTGLWEPARYNHWLNKYMQIADEDSVNTILFSTA